MKTLAAMLSLALLLAFGVGCDKERRPPPRHDENVGSPLVPWEPPADIRSLADVEADTRTLELPEARRFPECYEILEEAGEPRDTFPLSAREERALALASCEIEAYATLDDGTRILGWGAAPEAGSRARDLIVAAWGADGKLRWSQAMDRTRQAPNWVANFRRSFIVEVGDRHICFGTLWEGETQGQCVDPKTGESRWSGSLPFWSGIVPQTGEDGFYVADLSSLTKRYPFSGAEMRHIKLSGLGGRAGYYSSDGKRLFFATSREERPELVAYDFATLAPVWRVPLPGNPNPALAHAFDRFDLVLFKRDANLYALDSETGKVRWAHEIGDDVPPFAAHGDLLFMLNRRPDDPNMLYAIDPKTGDVKWKAETPSGTLRVESVDGVLVLGSVRAVQALPDVTIEKAE